MLRAANASRKKVLLAGRVVRADSFQLRLRGLQFRRGLDPNEGLLLEPCSSIHSFFMRFRFDALFLDEKNRVVRAVAGMRPWRLSWGAKGSRRVLELPAGRIAGTGTRVGDTITFEPAL